MANQCGGNYNFPDRCRDPAFVTDPECGGAENQGPMRLVHGPVGAEPPPEDAAQGLPAPEPGSKTPPVLLDAQLTLGDEPILHAFPTEQELLFPVPFYFEPPPAFVFNDAQLCDKPFGARTWRCSVMKKLGAGLAVQVDCDHTTTTGNLRYFVRLRDANGETIASLGSAKAPMRVVIKQTIEGGPPRLPRMPPPARCRWESYPPR